MPSTIPILIELFNRDLSKLEEEIKLYENEALLWKVHPGISNSAGNLCLHLCGNLQHFIGAVLGKDGYVRDREAEFNMKNISKSELLALIEQTKSSVTNALQGLQEVNLSQEYPLVVLGKSQKTDFFLMHLVAHLNYHLGQINYHRRMIR